MSSTEEKEDIEKDENENNENEKEEKEEEEEEKEKEEKKEYEILPEDFSNYDLSFKIIVIGDSDVGKSCLTMKATKNYFENYYSPTVGFEFFTFIVRIKDKCIRLQIWDTCGQEVYRSLISGFYRNSSLAILVYAIDNKESFKNIESWLNELKTLGNPNVKIFLIGNKKDLEMKREVTYQEGEKFYKDHCLNMFLETSAKTGFNAKKVFIEAANILYEENKKYKERSKLSNAQSFKSWDFGPDSTNQFYIDDDDESDNITKKKSRKCC